MILEWDYLWIRQNPFRILKKLRFARYEKKHGLILFASRLHIQTNYNDNVLSMDENSQNMLEPTLIYKNNPVLVPSGSGENDNQLLHSTLATDTI